MISPYVSTVAWCPFMVSLKQLVNGSLTQCGGSIITTTLTLTAAHCLLNGSKGLMLKFGSIHLFNGGSEFEATRISNHEAFDPFSLANDIGIASIFPARLQYSYNIQPIKLPINLVPLEHDDWITIYGWGATSDQKSFSSTLRSVTLPLVPKTTCRKLLKGWVPENTFCLGYPDGHVDACLGDSGGPAVLRGVQVGITSFGEGCGVPYKPGVYTDLKKYISWLNLMLNRL